MPIQRHTDQANRLTTLTASGELKPEELLEAVGAFKHDPPAINILWDFRQAYPSQSIDAEFMQQIAGLVKKTIGSRTNGRTAFVAPSDFVAGNAIMYQKWQRKVYHP